MIDNELEMFTAESARESGLFDAIKRGEATVEGSYRLTASGLQVKQRAFVFRDKLGGLRVGRFKDESEILEALGYADTDKQWRIDCI